MVCVNIASGIYALVDKPETPLQICRFVGDAPRQSDRFLVAAVLSRVSVPSKLFTRLIRLSRFVTSFQSVVGVMESFFKCTAHRANHPWPQHDQPRCYIRRVVSYRDSVVTVTHK